MNLIINKSRVATFIALLFALPSCKQSPVNNKTEKSNPEEISYQLIKWAEQGETQSVLNLIDPAVIEQASNNKISRGRLQSWINYYSYVTRKLGSIKNVSCKLTHQHGVNCTIKVTLTFGNGSSIEADTYYIQRNGVWYASDLGELMSDTRETFKNAEWTPATRPLGL